MVALAGFSPLSDFYSIRLTTREAGELVGTSHARVTQLERGGDSLNLMTVSRTASRLGYRTKLVFEPENGDGPSVTAPLPGA